MRLWTLQLLTVLAMGIVAAGFVALGQYVPTLENDHLLDSDPVGKLKKR